MTVKVKMCERLNRITAVRLAPRGSLRPLIWPNLDKSHSVLSRVLDLRRKRDLNLQSWRRESRSLGTKSKPKMSEFWAFTYPKISYTTLNNYQKYEICLQNIL